MFHVAVVLCLWGRILCSFCFDFSNTKLGHCLILSNLKLFIRQFFPLFTQDDEGRTLSDIFLELPSEEVCAFSHYSRFFWFFCGIEFNIGSCHNCVFRT